MYKAPRGTIDILPQDQAYRRFVEQKALEMCRLYGYQRIDTPVFEQTGLFYHSVGQGTDIAEKEMYTFNDRSDDSMTLRPEGTAPVCRAYLEHGMQNMSQPVRLYYFGSIFRYERPQAGRYRQHQQFGVEALGDADPALDAEVIDMAWNLYASLGLSGLTVKLNSIGCRHCRPVYLQILREYYSNHSQAVCRDCKVRMEKNLLRVLDCKEPSCQEIIQNAPKIPENLCGDCNTHFETLKEYLGYQKISFEIDPYIVRGLDYYTRTVFEVQPEGGGAQSTIGGGGRYDVLIEQIGGKPTPGVGFGTGIERIILNLQKQGIEPPALPGPQVYVAYLGEVARAEAVKLVSRLRQSGIGAVLAMGGKSLKAQLKQANTLGMTRTIIMGEDEVRKGTVLLRDMAQGEQSEITRDDIVTLLANVSS